MSGAGQAQLCFSHSLKAERGLPRQSIPEQPHSSLGHPGQGEMPKSTWGFQQGLPGVETEKLSQSWATVGPCAALVQVQGSEGGDTLQGEVTSRTRCHQLALELEGDFSH